MYHGLADCVVLGCTTLKKKKERKKGFLWSVKKFQSM
jgi:hypothetical protein